MEAPPRPAPDEAISNCRLRPEVPGLYKFTSTAFITGADVVLVGGPNDVWIFQIAADLQMGSMRQVVLVGGARASNIFWQVGTSAVIDTFSSFKGTIMADQSITVNTSSVVEGRLLAFTGGVTFNGASGSVPAEIVSTDCNNNRSGPW